MFDLKTAVTAPFVDVHGRTHRSSLPHCWKSRRDHCVTAGSNRGSGDRSLGALTVSSACARDQPAALFVRCHSDHRGGAWPSGHNASLAIGRSWVRAQAAAIFFKGGTAVEREKKPAGFEPTTLRSDGEHYPATPTGFPTATYDLCSHGFSAHGSFKKNRAAGRGGSS